MATSLNFSGLGVDARGRVTFSGLGTGIDIQGAVDALIKAKRIPIDRIEQRISDQQARIAAFQDLSALAQVVRGAVDKLRGAVSFGGASDVFQAKQAFATTARDDAQAPSPAATLLGVTVTNAAQATGHTIEIHKIASAHKVASTSVPGGLDDPLALAGTFEINGREIGIGASDTLRDVRDRINAANTGAAGSGVTASIVSLSASEHVLVLTADKTGTSNVIAASDTGGDVLESLGVLTAGGAFANELKAAENAELQVDGLATTIVRESNTIDDIFAGVTLDLFKAEAGTTVTLDVTRDLNQVKAAIVGLVEAYNELRVAINRAGLSEGGEEGSGALAGTSGLSEIRARLSAAIGASADAADPALAVLAQIGITFKSQGQVADPLLAGALDIDQSKLDEALLNQPDAVRTLFAFGLSSSSAEVRLAGFDGNTQFDPAGYTLNVAWADGKVVSANIGGAADGSDDGTIQVAGDVLTVTGGKAKGLKLLFTGSASVSGVQLDVSVGIGAKLHNALGAMVSPSTGLIASEIGSLEQQSGLAQARAERLEERLERERERLLERFVAMETAITAMNRLMDGLKQQLDSFFNNSKR